jgi:Concanavalin A-like lectin/glucanases superfamily
VDGIGCATTEAQGGAALASAAWTHLVVAYDGSKVRYVNGVQAGTIAGVA